MQNQYRLALGIVVCLLSAGVAQGTRNKLKTGSPHGGIAHKRIRHCQQSTDTIACIVTLQDQNERDSQKKISVETISNVKPSQTLTNFITDYCAQNGLTAHHAKINQKTYQFGNKQTERITLSALMTKNDKKLTILVVGTPKK